MAFPFLQTVRQALAGATNDNIRAGWHLGGQATMAATAPAAAEAPRPLVRPPGAPSPYPCDALGSVLGDAARGIAELVQAPPAMCGNSVLAAATLAVQPHADVVLPIFAGTRPIGDLFITVGLSGDRKSAVDRLATSGIQNYQRFLATKYEGDLKKYRAEQRAAAAQGLEEPEAPLRPEFLIEEPNAEGIYRLLRDGRGSLGLFADEGGRFLGGYAMAEDQKLKTASMLSQLWDGKAISRVRGGEAASILYGRRFSGHLMLQPGIAPLLLADTKMQAQGLLSRLLVTAPETLMGSRMYQEASPTSEAAVERYTAHLLSLVALPWRLAPHTRNEPWPRELPLSAAAKKVWVPFNNEVEAELKKDGKLVAISGISAKMAEQAARMAAVLTLFDDLGASEVSAEHMEAGVELGRHYVTEALRLFGAPAEDPDLALAAQLGAWLLQHWRGKLVSPVEVYQSGPTRLRDASTAKRILGVLERHFWIVRMQGTRKVNGTRRSEVWYVVPQDGP